jgi:hypothetical protein
MNACTRNAAGVQQGSRDSPNAQRLPGAAAEHVRVIQCWAADRHEVLTTDPHDALIAGRRSRCGRSKRVHKRTMPSIELKRGTLTAYPLGLLSGADATRTCDLRRDRPTWDSYLLFRVFIFQYVSLLCILCDVPNFSLVSPRFCHQSGTACAAVVTESTKKPGIRPPWALPPAANPGTTVGTLPRVPD